MMTQGLLLDPNILDEDDVLQLYQTAFKLLLEGQVYMKFAGESSEFTTEFPITVAQMLSEARYCLRQMNPAKYGHNNTQVQPFFV